MQYIFRVNSTSYQLLIDRSAYLELYQRSKTDCFGKNNLTLSLTSFAKHSILSIGEGSQYVLGFKCVKILNIPVLSICQGCKFP